MNHDMGLRIYVGTTSDTKNSYVKQSVLQSKYDQIIPVDVASGVADQPFNDEVEAGAKNRARAAFYSDSKTINQKIGIGMEGGLLELDDKLHLVCVASIYEGTRYYVYSSAPIQLPESVAEKVRQGYQFGEEIRKYEASNEEGDIISELISREKSFKYALNEVIASLNNGLIDSKFIVPWENFKNTLMVTNSDGLNKIPTRIYKIIKIN